MSIEPTQSAQGEGGGERRRLPRRDLVLLPLLVALTVAVVGGGAEVVSRILYPAKEINACLVRAKGAAPLYYKGGCASRTKIPEGPWVTNAYNACGSRTPEACGPKPAGAIRVAVVGSSTSAGYMVNYADSFAARASAALTKACRRPVEFQNLGGEGYDGAKVLPQVDKAVAEQADAVVMVLTTFDIENGDTPENRAGGGPPGPPPPDTPLGRLRATISASRALYMAQYFLLSRDESYLPFWIRMGDKPGFMRRPLSPDWIQRLDRLEALMAMVAAKAQAGKAPMVLVFAPQRSQAAMSASGRDWPGFDPFSLGDALQQMAARHGVDFVDITRAIPEGTPSSRIYYPVNRHLNGEGHKIVSQALVDRVMTDRLGPFADCAPQAH